MSLLSLLLLLSSCWCFCCCCVQLKCLCPTVQESTTTTTVITCLRCGEEDIADNAVGLVGENAGWILRMRADLDWKRRRRRPGRRRVGSLYGACLVLCCIFCF